MRTYLSLVSYAVLLARAGDFGASEGISGEAAALKEADWPPGVLLQGIWSEAWVRSTQGRYQVALDLWKSYYQLAASLGDRYLSNVALAYQKEMLDFLGRYSEAIAVGRDVLARIRREAFSTDVRMWVLANLSRTLTVVGELDVFRNLRPGPDQAHVAL